MAAKSTKRKKSTKSTPRKKQQNTEIQSEIIILATLAVSILLVLSNFGAGGIVGEAVSSFFIVKGVKWIGIQRLIIILSIIIC